MKTVFKARKFLGMCTLLMTSASPTFGDAFAPAVCLPTCNANDAKMLALAGAGLQTLAGDSISLHIVSSGNTPEFEIGIFDGDATGTWDLISTLLYPNNGPQDTLFVLYADRLDPNTNTPGTTIVDSWTSFDMNENDWSVRTINNNNTAAVSPNGDYRYRLEIINKTPGKRAINGFKVAVNNGASMSADPQSISFIGQYISDQMERKIIYPNWTADAEVLLPTTYDGKWVIRVNVPAGATTFEFWDGDLDFGDTFLLNSDTDDPDTPNDVLPEWAAGTAALFEGVATNNFFDSNGNLVYQWTGNPPDDTSVTKYLRSPNIRYKVCDPSNKCYYNANPSGNLEWEQFKLTTQGPADPTDPTKPSDPTLGDYLVPSIPAGIWTIELEGVDLHNLNAYRVNHETVGTPPCANFPHCDQLEPSNRELGDFVWFDSNRNGIQDQGESGIAGVKVNLFDGYSLNKPNPVPVQTTVTDGNGLYLFSVPELGTYTVVVDAANFLSGGPLDGLNPTVDYNNDGKGDNKRNQDLISADNFANGDNKAYDFGYSKPCDLGASQTLTQGGWSNKAHAKLLNALYNCQGPGQSPNCGFSVVLGKIGGRSITLATALAVQNFLPSGGTPRQLDPSNPSDPIFSTKANTVNIKNTLAGQTATAILNFSQWPTLGGAVLTSGPYVGRSVFEVIGLANQALSSGASKNVLSNLTNALDAINRNQDDGNPELHNLICPGR